MKKITKERSDYLKAKHMELWTWLAQNPEEKKENWPGFADPQVLADTSAYCFACEFAKEVSEDDSRYCSYCPLDSKRIGCSFVEGLFTQWQFHKGKSRAELAEEIRDLPWLEDNVVYNYAMIDGEPIELTAEQVESIKPKKRWRAKKRDKYWFVDDYGVHWEEEAGTSFDDYRYYTHNYFDSMDKAQKYDEVLKTEMQLLKLADEKNREPFDWNDNKKPKYHLIYSHSACEISYYFTHVAREARVVYFNSEEIVQQVIKEMNERRLIEYLTYEW